MKNLTLLINGEEKTFTIPFVSGLIWRKWIELRANAEDLTNLMVKEIDGFAGLVVLAFKDQFTLEQFYEGIPHDKVMITIDELFLPSDQEQGDEGNGKK